MTVLPRRIAGDAPGSKRAPVLRDIAGEDRVALVEPIGPNLEWVIPAMPEVAGPELFGFPAQVGFFGFARLKGGVTEELGVPLADTEFPGNFGAAEFALALVPAAIHGPVPCERGA